MQAGTQSTEPHQPGQFSFFLVMFLSSFGDRVMSHKISLEMFPPLLYFLRISEVLKS